MVVSVSASRAQLRARVTRALVGCAALLVLGAVGPSAPQGRSAATRPWFAKSEDVAWSRAALTAPFEATRARAQASPFTMEPEVVLSATLRASVTQLAEAFRTAAGRSFHVTSGARTPLEQARAMFDKLANGGRLTGLYRDYDAARQIEQAYQRARRAGRTPCVAAMARVVSDQVARGLYISRHLHAGAVDIRSRDMNARERRTFRQVVARQRGVRLLEEGRPPHFHLEFPTNRR